MADQLKELVKTLAGNWATAIAMGSFALYLVGYLALRFHLTVLGIGTDLAVLDERYLFFGAKFMVYLVATIPSVLLIVLIVAAIGYLLYRSLPSAARAKILGSQQRIWNWWSHPTRLALTGIVLSVCLIQFVMRQCFFLSNLLVSTGLPEPGWLQDILLDESDGIKSLYFCGLVAGVALTGGIYTLVGKSGNQGTASRFLHRLLAFLLAVQFLFLPVNYGILIADKTMPRVSSLDGRTPLETGRAAWLVWQGKQGMTYLVSNRETGKNERTLITLSREEVRKVVIEGYDPIRRILLPPFQDDPVSKQKAEKKKT